MECNEATYEDHLKYVSEMQRKGYFLAPYPREIWEQKKKAYPFDGPYWELLKELLKKRK